ncbi:MAG: hypothetical protein ACKOVH_03420 [Actinomycetota bacterium]
MIRDPGLPQDPDHEAFRDLDHYGRVRDEPSPPGDGVAPIGSPLPHEVVYPALREYPDVPILDWCYAYPLSLGRAAPGARRVRWNGQIVTGEPGDDGPGALWTHPGTAHLRPVSAPPVRSQSGISRMGIRRAGGVTAAGIVVVPRTSLLEVAEYADATLNWSGAEGDLPTRGLGEWSLAIGGGPAGVWFGIRTVSFGGPRQGIADRRRFAEVVGAEWIIEVGGIDHDGAAVHDRLRVCTFDAYEVYRWDDGETHLVSPSAIEPSLDPADVRTLHDVKAFVNARRAPRLPWVPSSAPPGW